MSYFDTSIPWAIQPEQLRRIDTLATEHLKSAAAAPQAETSANYLSMKINGVEWKADHGVFGAFHPQGYNKVIIIAGDAGKIPRTGLQPW